MASLTVDSRSNTVKETCPTWLLFLFFSNFFVFQLQLAHDIVSVSGVQHIVIGSLS